MKTSLNFLSSLIGNIYKPCLIAFYTLLITACTGNMPNNLGVNNHLLQSCPNSPNCVSSFEIDDVHSIDPILFSDDKNLIEKELLSLIKQHSNMHLVQHTGRYIYAQFTSDIMGFVDDMEFLVEDKKVQVRSASRLGYSDLGANRTHIEVIRKNLK
ncbi:MAG: DUF1499 domain-containing protein [Bermanella sp.]